VVILLAFVVLFAMRHVVLPVGVRFRAGVRGGWEAKADSPVAHEQRTTTSYQLK
jgi:hypothetical protein